jgi:hypothetical protein
MHLERSRAGLGSAEITQGPGHTHHHSTHPQVAALFTTLSQVALNVSAPAMDQIEAAFRKVVSGRDSIPVWSLTYGYGSICMGSYMAALFTTPLSQVALNVSAPAMDQIEAAFRKVVRDSILLLGGTDGYSCLGSLCGGAGVSGGGVVWLAPFLWKEQSLPSLWKVHPPSLRSKGWGCGCGCGCCAKRTLVPLFTSF